MPADAMPLVMEVMTREVFAVAPDTSLETAARLLTERRVSGAPVIDAQHRVVGVISLSDLADPDRTPSEDPGYPVFYRVTDGWTDELGDHAWSRPGCVRDLMTAAVISVPADATVVEAANRMLQLGVHRLLVVHGERLSGVVSTVDLLRAFARLHGGDG
ncbi:MAG: CBS domain-containing protein [Deltaproteobacteria bacterium]|nr:CBS domain-containing protein [Deltaproteobacteria bacterium]MBP7286210.1 CBS domain-containing protein [Nannocystaceae bacterium]